MISCNVAASEHEIMMSAVLPKTGTETSSPRENSRAVEKDEDTDGEITSDACAKDAEDGEITGGEPDFENMICCYFRRGKCSYGSSCGFYHISELGLYSMFDENNKRTPVIPYRSAKNSPVTPPPGDYLERAWEKALAEAKDCIENNRKRKESVGVKEENPQIRNVEFTNGENHTSSNSQLRDKSSLKTKYTADSRQHISREPPKSPNSKVRRYNKESNRPSAKSSSPQGKMRGKRKRSKSPAGKKSRRSKFEFRSGSSSKSCSDSTSFSSSASSWDCSSSCSCEKASKKRKISSSEASDRKGRCLKSLIQRPSRKKERSSSRSSNSSIIGQSRKKVSTISDKSREKNFSTEEKLFKNRTFESRFTRCKKGDTTSDPSVSKPREKNNFQIAKKVRSFSAKRSRSRSPTRSSDISTLSASSSGDSFEHIYRGAPFKKDLPGKSLSASCERKTISSKKPSFSKRNVQPSFPKQSPQRIKSLPTFKLVDAYKSNFKERSSKNIGSDVTKTYQNIIINKDSCKRNYSRIDELHKSCPPKRNSTCKNLTEAGTRHSVLKPHTLPTVSSNVISTGDFRRADSKKRLNSKSGRLSGVPSKIKSTGNDVSISEKRDLNLKSGQSHVVSTKISSTGTSLLQDLKKYLHRKPKQLHGNSPSLGSTDKSLEKDSKKDLNVKTAQRSAISSKMSSAGKGVEKALKKDLNIKTAQRSAISLKMSFTGKGLNEIPTKNVHLKPEGTLDASKVILSDAKVGLKTGSALAVPQESGVKKTACVHTKNERKEASGAVAWLLSYSRRPRRANHALNEKSEEPRPVRTSKVAREQIETKLGKRKRMASKDVKKSKSRNAPQPSGESSNSKKLKLASKSHLRQKFLLQQLHAVDEAIARKMNRS